MSTYSYWQYFLAIEADFAATARYVEICPDNFKTYSVEYAKLLLASASEIDVLCKLLCEQLDPNAKRRDINDYRACIAPRAAELPNEKVLLRRYSIELKPWEAWAGSKNPEWWKSYNNVKHHRDKFYSEAKLKNCLDSVAALFILVIYLHKAQNSNAELAPMPQLIGREMEPSHMLYEDSYTVPDFKTPQ